MFATTDTRKAQIAMDPYTGECWACVNPFEVTTGEEYEELRERILTAIAERQKVGAA